MQSLYLRKETADFNTGGDTFKIPAVAYYRDAAATDRVCLNSWPSRPDRRFKRVAYNCATYRVVWLPDL